MREELLGYLLGALDEDEMQRVSEWLRDNPDGQRQLRELELRLRPLEEGFEAVEAPSDDLISRTLAGLPDGIPSESDEESESEESYVTLSKVNLAAESGKSRNRWRLLDSIGGLLAVATLFALLLPTIADDRFEARKTACQDQLREFGTAIAQYVTRNEQERLPQVAEQGPEAFAGVYALRLADAGLLTDASLRWCPSADVPVLLDLGRAEMDQLPSVGALSHLELERLKAIQQVAGGHYAYSLGVLDKNSLVPPKYESRGTFAVMADAPLTSDPSRLIDASANRVSFAHGCEGTNVLYEDGSVQFIRMPGLSTMPDHPFLNHVGEWEAGVNIDDASLAPSWRAPFSHSLQR
ncbi:MAG: hypothetical protein AAF802_09585 [Planctomycetota bacterium]